MKFCLMFHLLNRFGESIWGEFAELYDEVYDPDAEETITKMAEEDTFL